MDLLRKRSSRSAKPPFRKNVPPFRKIFLDVSIRRRGDANRAPPSPIVLSGGTTRLPAGLDMERACRPTNGRALLAPRKSTCAGLFASDPG
jgi:hypothetical protein